MILVGRYLSPFVRRVAVTMKLYGLSYEHRPLIAFGEDKKIISQWNPVGRVPVLILDDGEVLFESGVILDHLDELAGAERALIPESGAARRNVLRLMSMATGAADKAILTIYEKRFRPEEKWHEPWTTLCGSQTKDALEALDKLATMPWFAGDIMSQADVTAVCCWDFINHANPELASRISAPRLDDICLRAGEMREFSETVPAP